MLGSAQVGGALEGPDHGGLRRLQAPPRSDLSAFEPVPCDVFITEATFGLPVFRHPDDRDEIARLLRSVAQFPERSHLVGAYALGKAQRMIRLLREAGWDGPIYVHGALERLNALYERQRRRPRRAPPATSAKRTSPARSSSPRRRPSQDRWSRRFPDPVVAFASGWMQVRARARQRGVELPLVISDHADWDELTATVDELRPASSGSPTAARRRWPAGPSCTASPPAPLALVGYEDEDDD